MTPLEMIAEWRKGCSCAGPLHDQLYAKDEANATSPAECTECTEGLVRALEEYLKCYPEWPSDLPFMMGDPIQTKRAPFFIGPVVGWYRRKDGQLGLVAELDAVESLIHVYPAHALIPARDA